MTRNFDATVSPDRSFPPTAQTIPLIAVAFILETLAVVSFALRLLSRRPPTKALGKDEWFILAATCFTIAQLGSFVALYCNGVGYHMTVAHVNGQLMIQLLLTFEMLYLFGVNGAKISALFFYRRIFVNKTIRTPALVLIIVISIYTIFQVLLFWLNCMPLKRLWTDGGCTDRRKLYLPTAIFSIITDVLIIVLPMPALWRLSMTRANKLRLTLVFSVGLIVTAVSIARTVANSWIVYRMDFSYTGVYASFFSTIEPPLTIFCVNLPAIHRWVFRSFPKISGDRYVPPADQIKPGVEEISTDLHISVKRLSEPGSVKKAPRGWATLMMGDSLMGRNSILQSVRLK